MTQKETFGETIKAIRKKQKMTQKMLAQGICAQSVLSRIENGNEVPNVVVLQSICQRLNVTMDQVLHSDFEEIQRVKAMFSSVHQFFIHQNYQAMEAILKEPKLIDSLYLDTDFQLYYYYLGSCEFFLHQSYELAIQSLKKGLSYTYTSDKVNVAPIEILLMSCLGKVYGDVGHVDKASAYLATSYELLENLTTDNSSFQLTKVFFNYGSFLFEIEDFELSLKISKQGILWAQQRVSYYYLKELFLLCGQLHQKLQQNDLAKNYFDLAEIVTKIRLNGVDLS